MPLISGRFLAVLAVPLSQRGLPVKDWIDGLPVRAEQVLDPSEPLEWDDMVALLDRAAAQLGGPEQLETLMLGVRPSAAGGLASVFELMRTPERVYEVLARYVSDHLSPPLHARLETRRFRPIVLDLTLDDDVRASPAVWYALLGSLRRGPRDLGLPIPTVTTSFGERHARFEIRLTRRPFFSRLLWVGAFGASRRLVREFQEQQLALQQSFNDLKRQAEALRASEAKNFDLVQQLEHVVAERTSELETRGAQLRALQSQLIRAERLGAAQELAGSVAHAINNPLGALIGRIELMLETADTPDPRVEHMLQISRRIKDVVTRTLQLFRQVELDLTRADPGRMLEDVCAELRPLVNRSGVDLQVKIEPGLPPLDADGALLRAALESLVENAIEVSPQGGTVWLELGSVPSMQVIEFRIIDTGPGIAPELREKVLEPFFTTKPGGTGLGLAIARGVIAGHRGRLTLLPRPGGGTIASVELPLSTDADGVSARAS